MLEDVNPPQLSVAWRIEMGERDPTYEQILADHQAEGRRKNAEIERLHAELADAKARIAELEAAGKRLGDAAIAGILDGRDRAERAEAELAALRKNAPEWFAALRKVEAERDAMREALLGLSSAASVLLDEAMSFSVCGVYFSEKCMGHKGPDLVSIAIDMVSAVLNRAALNPSPAGEKS